MIGLFIVVELCFLEEVKDGKVEFVDFFRLCFVVDCIKGFGMICLVDCENGVICCIRVVL